MVDRLITSLRALAACDRSQEQSRCAEVALDFSDALLLVSDCPQVELTPAQRGALQDLDDHLQRMTGDGNAGVQHGDGRPPDMSWTTVRSLAAEALRILGHPTRIESFTHSHHSDAL
ncbi:MAG TPA: hypothetical protein VHG09_01915 [Longimicrobiales bacterium]|nr:hypothetical protein [Longimicrobiales bacterium]